MGNRSKNPHICWHSRIRAINDHFHKKLVKLQKQHLKKIKSKRDLREIQLASRFGSK